MKFIKIGRTISFAITLLSTIPLFVNYLSGSEPKYQFIVDLHVWFGVAFFIFAIISMILPSSASVGERRKPRL